MYKATILKKGAYQDSKEFSNEVAMYDWLYGILDCAELWDELDLWEASRKMLGSQFYKYAVQRWIETGDGTEQIIIEEIELKQVFKEPKGLQEYIEYHLGKFEVYNVPLYIKSDHNDFVPLMVSVQDLLNVIRS